MTATSLVRGRYEAHCKRQLWQGFSCHAAPSHRRELAVRFGAGYAICKAKSNAHSKGITKVRPKASLSLKKDFQKKLVNLI